MAIGGKILNAKVMHLRTLPRKNSFIYNQQYVFLKAGKDWEKTPALFSVNKFNLFSICFTKYGNRSGENPYFYALKMINDLPGKNDWLSEIYLLTQPRIFGWSFNPVSFWFYLDHEKNIRAVLAEVNNTFGGRQKYFCYLEGFDVIHENTTLEGDKVFHVSPFFKVEGTYQFRFKKTERSLGIWIDYSIENKLHLSTSQVGFFKNITNTSLLLLFLKSPFAHCKTIILIHWQAVKIYLKKIKYHPYIAKKEKREKRCR